MREILISHLETKIINDLKKWNNLK
jgi:hypothetical protein